MAAHNKLGHIGEEAAATYLESRGYLIRHRNWRLGHLELDIIAQQQNQLIIVEVKTRRNTDYAMPQEAVTPQKRRRLSRAAHAYQHYEGLNLPVRFDILTVVGDDTPFKFEHIREAFRL